MNIAEIKGEKTIGALAKRLLAEPTKSRSKATQTEMEAALIRLNPHLSEIRHLEKGTPVLVPEEFRLAADESVRPLRGIAEELLSQSENALTNLQATLHDRAAQFSERSERVQTWLKSDKELLRRSPELKKVLSSATAAARTLPKEQAAAVASEVKALDKVRSQLAKFRKT